jgi:hypothetical protein
VPASHRLAQGMPGDFTRIPFPEYAEEERSPFGELLEYLAGALGLDRAQVIPERGMEAGG